MQPSDLFKARCVFIVDSEGEDEAAGTPGDQRPPGAAASTASRPKSLPLGSDVLSDAVRPKVRGPHVQASGTPEAPATHAQPYKTTSGYKAFAAIPTNTLLLEQKALDEPTKTENVSTDSTLGLPVETPTTVPRPSGRETKYANLPPASSAVSDSQLTKPGVIRPVPVRTRILLKNEEEAYEPNPFSKYLEESSGFFSEQQ